jgi:flagellar biosynthesis protein FlhF
MIVRSYTGRTVPEALEKVKNDLGDGALIIETRAIREPGLLGRKSGYEVVAAIDDAPSKATRVAVPAVPGEPQVTAWKPQTLDAPVANQAAALARERGEEAAALALEEELVSIRRQLARLAAGQGTPRGHLGEEIAAQLDDGELPGELVAELDEAMARAGGRLDAAKHREFLSLLMARNLPCPGALDWTTTQKLMLVGPTGVEATSSGTSSRSA